MFARVGVLCIGLIALAAPARAQQAPNGEAVFKQSCASCHREGQNDAPTRDALRQMTPESIYNAQTLGR
ncbi:MAG TPA: cytochrome c, partial [Vicinamibacterales bacterium]|nr:cytochrome c [Vicinamibacterales bacterium]